MRYMGAGKGHRRVHLHLPIRKGIIQKRIFLKIKLMFEDSGLSPRLAIVMVKLRSQ